MARRTAQPLPAMTTEELIRFLLGQLEQLERRVASLEGAQGGSLPGDFRFEVSGDGSQVVVRRVSTDEAAPITPPL